jgi:hypothetical protein
MTNLFLSFLFTVHLAWDAPLEGECVDGYKVYHGSSVTLAAPVYSESHDVGLALECFYDVPANQYDYFAVTAYKDGSESDYGQPQVWIYYAR